MAGRNPPRKVTYFEPVPPGLARNTIIESTFEVGRRFRCTMRIIDCGQLDPGPVIRPEPGEWQPAHARAPRDDVSLVTPGDGFAADQMPLNRFRLSDIARAFE
jgi:hypothetical protein